MFLVQLRQQVELLPLCFRIDLGRRCQIENRSPDRAKQRPLISRRHIAARPVRLTPDRPPSFVEHHHIPGKVLILGTQPVSHPTPQRWPPDQGLPRVNLHEGRAVCMRIRVTGPHDRQLVRMFANVRKEIRNRKTALTPRLELPRGRCQEPDRSSPGVNVFLVGRHRLPGVLLEHRLRIEGIHLARSAVHQQKNAVLHLRRKVSRLRCQRIHRGFAGVANLLKKSLLLQHRRQSHPGKASSHLPQRLATRQSAGK